MDLITERKFEQHYWQSDTYMIKWEGHSRVITGAMVLEDHVESVDFDYVFAVATRKCLPIPQGRLFGELLARPMLFGLSRP